MSKIMTVAEICNGDMITALGNGYVIDVDDDHEVVSGRHGAHLGAHLRLITMNDDHGDEFYLLAPKDLEVEITRTAS